MLRVNNLFHEESLDYQNSGKYLNEREEEIESLQDILRCCMINDEKLECNIENLYAQEVEPEVLLVDWLFSGAGTGEYELRRLLMELLQTFTDYEEEKDYRIDISLGEQIDCIWNEPGYWACRRKILEGIHKPQEFYEFMKSCFINSEFSDRVRSALREIKDFPLHTAEIVHNLSLLNDEALDIYQKHQGNEAEAMRELAAKALECSGDPKHKHLLKFPFTYIIEENGEPRSCVAEITCEPHMKLIRRDSDLRIYFYWRDSRIGEGEKVLIGKIGGHPY
ncbi:MAG: hypothetical protein IKV59_09800 [Lachnospiraceae bacterium]|nr:hypothetical protein [Lachnospiraceae bacterium]